MSASHVSSASCDVFRNFNHSSIFLWSFSLLIIRCFSLICFVSAAFCFLNRRIASSAKSSLSRFSPPVYCMSSYRVAPLVGQTLVLVFAWIYSKREGLCLYISAKSDEAKNSPAPLKFAGPLAQRRVRSSELRSSLVVT